MSARKRSSKQSNESPLARLFLAEHRRIQRAFSLVLVAIRKPEYAKFNKLIDKYDFAQLRDNGSFSRPNHDRWLRAMAATPGERWKTLFRHQ